MGFSPGRPQRSRASLSHDGLICPSEPPGITIPPEPTVVARDNLPPSVPHDDPNVIPQDVPDDISYGTYDYTTILPPHHHTNTSVPGRVHVPPCPTADTTVTTESHNATPFLTAGSEKTLPKYSGKPKDDIHEFIFKLRPFLKHSSIDNWHLDASTTEDNLDKSKYLASLLCLCISVTHYLPSSITLHSKIKVSRCFNILWI